jgi:hypothetical protein
MNFVSGEKLQELADVSIALNIESNYASNLVKTQLQNTKTKCYVYDPSAATITVPDEIKQAKKIFVYTHILDFFFKNILPHIEGPVTLITHNSDCGVDANMLSYIDSPKIKNWFCQNRYISHPKLFSLPIGLGNSQWPHGNQQLISAIRNENNLKTNLVIKNFDTTTNPTKRNHCHHVTQSNGFHMHPQSSMEDYWRLLSRSHFAIAPHGNGVDCHRIWESLILKTIPIVEDHECYSQYKHLPMLFITDWNEVTVDFLNKKLEEIDKTQLDNIPSLYIEYYDKLINEDSRHSNTGS